jgi:hypothetical protein
MRMRMIDIRVASKYYNVLKIRYGGHLRPHTTNQKHQTVVADLQVFSPPPPFFFVKKKKKKLLETVGTIWILLICALCTALS